MSPQVQPPPAALTQKMSAWFDRLVSVFDEAPDVARAAIKKVQQEAQGDPEIPPDAAAELKTLAEAMGALKDGEELGAAGIDFEGMATAFQKAKEGFGNIASVEGLAHFAAARELYARVGLAARRGDVANATVFMQTLMSMRTVQGSFPPLKSLLDAVEPEHEHLQAANDLANGDLHGAAKHWDRAANSTAIIGAQAPKDSENAHRFHGMSLYYRSISRFLNLLNRYNQFAFDAIGDDKALIATAREAKVHLDQISGDPNMAKLAVMCTFFEKGLLAMNELSELMKKVLKSTFKPASRDLGPARQQILEARAVGNQAGELASFCNRTCDQFDEQMRNLERLATPNAKDGFLLGGLLASFIFAVLFLGILWAGWSFGLNMDGDHVIKLSYVCAGMAVIGGFGLTGLKYVAPAIFGHKGAKE